MDPVPLYLTSKNFKSPEKLIYKASVDAVSVTSLIYLSGNFIQRITIIIDNIEITSISGDT